MIVSATEIVSYQSPVKSQQKCWIIASANSEHFSGGSTLGSINRAKSLVARLSAIAVAFIWELIQQLLAIP